MTTPPRPSVFDDLVAERDKPQREPVAWGQTRYIRDRDGAPIGSDDPVLSWGSEPPEDSGWWPLYAAPPAQAAQMSLNDAFLCGYNRGLQHAEERAAAQAAPDASWNECPLCGHQQENCRCGIAPAAPDALVHKLRKPDVYEANVTLRLLAAQTIEHQARELARYKAKYGP